MHKKMHIIAAAAAAFCSTVVAGSAEPGFGRKPAVVKNGEGVQVSFSALAPCDVEVTVLDSTGREIRRLAAGILGGKEAAGPLAPGSLAQSLTWDGTDDFGQPTGPGKYKVRCRLGLRADTARVVAIAEADPGRAFHAGNLRPAPDPAAPGKPFKDKLRLWKSVGLAADRETDVLYAYPGTGGVIRHDGGSGKTDRPSGKLGERKWREGVISIGANGEISKGPYDRWTRGGTPLPLPDGTVRRQSLRLDNKHDVRLMSDSPFSNHWGPTLQLEGLDGRYYMCTTRLVPFMELHIFDTFAKRRVLRSGYQPWVGMHTSARIGRFRVDIEGKMYVSHRGNPKGVKVGESRWGPYGSIVKFDPEERWAREIRLPPGSPPEDPEERKGGVWWNNGHFLPKVERVYPGVILVPDGCTCISAPDFALDEYGRLFIPDGPRGSVLIMDNTGNEILKIENQVPSAIGGAQIQLGFPQNIVSTRRALYIWDLLNTRIIRIGLSHAAEAECEFVR